MSNTAAYFRYRAINACLRNRKRVWTVDYLLDSVNRELEIKDGPNGGIARPTLLKDLEDMVNLHNAPIDSYFAGKKKVYYYTVENYSFIEIPVTGQELDIIKEGANMLRQKPGWSTGIGLSEIARKLEERFEPDETERKIVSFQKAPVVLGVQYLEDMKRFIKEEQPIRITHQSFGAEQPCQVTLHPYLLKEDDHRWYVFGYVSEKEDVRTFGLERIRSIEVSDEAYVQSKLTDNEDHYRNVLGITVTPGEELHDVEVMFSPKLAPYLRTRYLHHTQQHQDQPDGSLHVRYQLKINPELISSILSYGPDVKVLKPQRLINEIKTALKNTLAHYE